MYKCVCATWWPRMCVITDAYAAWLRTHTLRDTNAYATLLRAHTLRDTCVFSLTSHVGADVPIVTEWRRERYGRVIYRVAHSPTSHPLQPPVQTHTPRDFALCDARVALSSIVAFDSWTWLVTKGWAFTHNKFTIGYFILRWVQHWFTIYLLHFQNKQKSCHLEKNQKRNTRSQ